MPITTTTGDVVRPRFGRLVALAVVAVVGLGLLASAPVAAVPGPPTTTTTTAPPPPPPLPLSHDVDVVVTADGDLRISGDDGPNRVDVHGSPFGYSVWVRKDNGRVVVHNLYGQVTGDVIVQMQGGDDRIHVGPSSAISFPGTLSIEGGDGADVIEVRNADIAGELIVRPESAPEGRDQDVEIWDTVVRDDLRFDTGDRTEFDLRSSTVERRAIFTSAGDGFAPNLWHSKVGRLLAFGGADRDGFGTFMSDLGTNPVINLRGGDDTVTFRSENQWDGRLTVALGAGEDEIYANNDGGLPTPTHTPLWPVDIRMGPGDDVLWIADGLLDDGLGSILRGGAGTDLLESPGVGSWSDATVVGFEHFS